jgi:TonB-dependent SusC/RagA subfamily outer membrane receptor
MRQILMVVGFTVALVGCTTSGSSHMLPPIPSSALCMVDGKDVSCDGVRQMRTNRIESIEVLRGPAAAALYGPRAATGVIVVSTKR